MKVEAKDPFETNPCEYDAWFDENENVYRSELLAIEALLPQKNGLWVEIGVGSGRFASKLGIDVGIEPADGIANLARKRGVNVKKGRAEELPLPDRSAAAAFLITSICFIADMDRAFAEVNRILIPGGVAIVAFVPRDSRLGEIYAETGSQDLFLRHARLRRREEIIDGLEATGFRIERCVHTLTGDPARANERVENPSAGCDGGSFVVVRAVKGEA